LGGTEGGGSKEGKPFFFCKWWERHNWGVAALLETVGCGGAPHPCGNDLLPEKWNRPNGGLLRKKGGIPSTLLKTRITFSPKKNRQVPYSRGEKKKGQKPNLIPPNQKKRGEAPRTIYGGKGRLLFFSPPFERKGKRRRGRGKTGKRPCEEGKKGKGREKDEKGRLLSSPERGERGRGSIRGVWLQKGGRGGEAESPKKRK